MKSRFRATNGRQVIFATGDNGASNSNRRKTLLIRRLPGLGSGGKKLESEKCSTVEELATTKKIDVSYLHQIFHLKSLAPNIVEAIVSDSVGSPFSSRSF